jgi:hypothetical protein
MAAGEESGIDSRGQSYVRGSGCRVGRSGGDEGIGESRFLTGLSARFGMTSLSGERHPQRLKAGLHFRGAAARWRRGIDHGG